MITTVITSITLGQSIFTAQLLAQRVKYSRSYLPLSAFFLVIGLIHLCYVLMDPILVGDKGQYQVQIALIKQALETVLAPLFWLYVNKLTADKKEHWKYPDSLHLILPITIFFGLAVFFQCVFKGLVTEEGAFSASLYKTLNAIILIQMFLYASMSVNSLLRYQSKLKSMFSNTANLIELGWFRWLMVLILSSLVLEVVAQYVYATEEMMPPFPGLNGVLTALVVWFFAIWGLRQRPELLLELVKHEALQKEAASKYQKSPLTEPKLVELSDKIKCAMEHEKLYKDPNLSLGHLSKHIEVLPNYVTQVLNTYMNETFFDYTNRLRIEEAKKILERTDDAVADIAISVGFNSRSTFYTAFKKSTGNTPGAYRKLREYRSKPLL